MLSLCCPCTHSYAFCMNMNLDAIIAVINNNINIIIYIVQHCVGRRLIESSSCLNWIPVIGTSRDDAWRSKLALCRMRIQGLGWLAWKVEPLLTNVERLPKHANQHKSPNHQHGLFASICTTSRLPVDIVCQRGAFWNLFLGVLWTRGLICVEQFLWNYFLLRYRVTSSPNSAHFSWLLEAWIFNATMLFTKHVGVWINNSNYSGVSWQ